MSWQDRIRQGAYTSPLGTRTVFQFENVSYSFDKKTTGFEFPNFNGTYVQESGNTGRRFPLRIIFSGDDYDLEAKAFEETLLERGIGKLEHPVYGVKDVIPFGAISRRDDLKTAANQAFFDITFWETIELIFPEEQDDPASSVETSVDEYNVAAGNQLENSTDLTGAVNQAKAKGNFTRALDSVKGGLQKVADTQADVTRQFNTIYNSINTGIDTLIGQPLTLAAQTVQLVQAPARALTSIQARLEAYKNLAENLIATGTAADSNDFHVNDMYASTHVTGQILSVINNEFDTKTEAIAAAESIISLFDSLVVWRDDNFAALEQIDQGEAYQKLQGSVAIAAGFLVQISFTLKQERIVVLDRNRSIIDTVAELYGDVDNYLDFFINSNDLTGSEILELPKGRSIVYYV